jgi:hypothetical protein
MGASASPWKEEVAVVELRCPEVMFEAGPYARRLFSFGYP